MRLTNGKILKRFFTKTDLLQEIYDFVFVHQEKGTNEKFKLITSFPKKEYDNTNMVINECNFNDGDLLNVMFI